MLQLTNDDFTGFLNDEREYLISLKQPPLQDQLHVRYVKVLNELEERRYVLLTLSDFFLFMNHIRSEWMRADEAAMPEPVFPLEIPQPYHKRSLKRTFSVTPCTRCSRRPKNLLVNCKHNLVWRKLGRSAAKNTINSRLKFQCGSTVVC